MSVSTRNYKFTIKGKKYEVLVREIEGNTAKVEVNGNAYEVELQREVPKTYSKPAPVQKAATEKAEEKKEGPVAQIKAPLPGIIIKVLVKTGEEVTAGQSVCTLETMKMENAIKAENGGTVKSVRVTPGQSVQQDEILIEIA